MIDVDVEKQQISNGAVVLLRKGSGDSVELELSTLISFEQQHLHI